MLKLRDLVILLIIYKLIDLNIIGKIIGVILPFLLAFVLAYTLYPMLKMLNRILPKSLSLMLILGTVFFGVVILIAIIVPNLYKEINNLVNILVVIINQLSNKYHFNSDTILLKLTNIDYKYILNGINLSITYVTKIILFIISLIYFLIDMDKIEKYIKGLTNKKIINYLYIVSKDVENYMSGLLKICIISFFEYAISFFIIGHNNYLLMGLVASLSNLIPCFGCVLILVVGIITSPNLLVKISILYLVLSNVDGYIINPYIFGRSNNIHPLINLIGVSVGGVLFGIKGVLLSLPIIIILYSTIVYIKSNNNLNDYKK